MAGIDVSFRPGGEYSFGIITDNLQAVELLSTAGVTVAALRAPDRTTAITLCALYFGYKLVKPLVDAAVKKALGGERDDQEVGDISRGSLLVKLHCFTNERFLEVLGYYESGQIKKRLEEEFSQIGIKVEGLKVKIENLAEVNATKEAINKRYHGCIIKNSTRVEHVIQILTNTTKYFLPINRLINRK